MTFATFGDSRYFETMHINVCNTRRIYPKASIYVGDLGLTDSQRSKLSECNIIPLTKTGSAAEAMLFKPLFLLRVLSVNPDPVCFIDGDAVLIRKLDLPKGMIVTVRDHPRKDARINTGVFVLYSVDFITDWIHRIYLLTLEKPGDRWNEQDAFNQVVYSNQYPFTEVLCEQYNYTRVEDGIPEDVKIVHLKKKRRFNLKLIKRVCEVQ